MTVLYSALETVWNLAAPMLTSRIAAAERSLVAYDVQFRVHRRVGVRRSRRVRRSRQLGC